MSSGKAASNDPNTELPDDGFQLPPAADGVVVLVATQTYDECPKTKQRSNSISMMVAAILTPRFRPVNANRSVARTSGGFLGKTHITTQSQTPTLAPKKALGFCSIIVENPRDSVYISPEEEVFKRDKAKILATKAKKKWLEREKRIANAKLQAASDVFQLMQARYAILRLFLSIFPSALEYIQATGYGGNCIRTYRKAKNLLDHELNSDDVIDALTRCGICYSAARGVFPVGDCCDIFCPRYHFAHPILDINSKTQQNIVRDAIMARSSGI
jgi:hypothetical protein